MWFCHAWRGISVCGDGSFTFVCSADAPEFEKTRSIRLSGLTWVRTPNPDSGVDAVMAPLLNAMAAPKAMPRTKAPVPDSPAGATTLTANTIEATTALAFASTDWVRSALAIGVSTNAAKPTNPTIPAFARSHR